MVGEIVERLKAAGALEVTFGDELDYDRAKMTITPQAHISPMAFNIPNLDSVRILTFEIFIFGLLAHYKERAGGQDIGQKNTVDVLDNCVFITDKFISGLRDRTINIGEGGYMKLRGAPSFNMVYEEGNSGVAGLIGTVEFEFTNLMSLC